MPLETVARYRSYATQCVKIADRLSTIPVQLELLVMARVWIALADEADKTRNPISLPKWVDDHLRRCARPRPEDLVCMPEHWSEAPSRIMRLGPTQ